jgi:polyisoprenoid-binding protein YceI
MHLTGMRTYFYERKTTQRTMKTRIIRALIFISGVILMPFLLEAQTTYGSKQSKMSVQGTSSLHEWESDVTQVEWKGTVTVQGNQLVEIKDVHVKIPVTGIKSTKGRIMDNKTYEAFNSDKNPNIQYRLTNTKITGSGEYTVVANGNLTMAGVTRPVELTAKAKVLSNGDVQLVGSRKLNMKDFSMTPPTAMMGTIKVGEEVTVKFDITLTPDNKLTTNK